MTFKELDRLARGRRFSSGGTDLCTRALIGVKLENLEGGRGNMITVTGNSKVSEVFDNEVLRRKPIIWFELEPIAVKDTAPKAVQIRKSNLAPSCKESNTRSDHMKITRFVDPPSQGQSASGRSTQFDVKASKQHRSWKKNTSLSTLTYEMMTHYLPPIIFHYLSEPNIEGVLAAIGLSPDLVSRIARSKEVPKKEILRNTAKSETVEDLPPTQKRADDSERVTKNEEVFKVVPGDDDWFDDDGHNCVMDGSGDCHDDHCEAINRDDGLKCDDYDSRNCDSASVIDDDNGSANPPQMNVAEEVDTCKIKSEIAEECVQMEVSSKMRSNASGANAREIIVIDDDSDEEEHVSPVTESKQTTCQKRDRKVFEMITKEHDIYNIEDDDDEEGESVSDTSDDDDGMHKMAQITHTASSRDVKRHRGGGSISSSRSAQAVKATSSGTKRRGVISKSAASATVHVSRPASFNVRSKATACVTTPAIEQHVLHDTPMMTITRHPVANQQPFDSSLVTNEEVNDCVSPRPLDVTRESTLSESREEDDSFEEDGLLSNAPTLAVYESECRALCAGPDSISVDTHIDSALRHVNGITAAQSLHKLPQDNESTNTFFGKAIMEFSLRQYDTINKMINTSFFSGH